MKKRLLSFFLVLTLMFSGAFSCFASADSGDSTADRLFNGFWDFFESGSQLYEDVFDFGRHTREYARDYIKHELFGMEEAQENDVPIYDANGSYSAGMLRNMSPSINTALDYTDRLDCFSIRPGAALKCTIDPHSTFTLFGSCDNMHSFNFQFYYSDGSYVNSYPWKCYYNGRSPFSISNDTDDYLFYYLRVGFWCNDDSTPDAKSSARILVTGDGFHWGWSSELSFSSEFNVNEINDLDIDLTSSRNIDPTVDGELYISAGIIYKTEDDATYCSDHVRGETVTSGDNWHWKFDLGELSYYLYRKRCGFDNFKAFVSVMKVEDGSYLYSREFPLTINPPGGVFDDTEDPPRWEDYKPDPTPFPEFNFNQNNNFNFTYNNNFQYITNLNVDQSTTTNDYYTWIDDSITVINNNMNIVSENIINLGNAFSDYFNNCFNDMFVYLGDILEKIDCDINNNFDAIGNYIGDLIDVVNFNTQIIIDNIKQYLDDKFIPDSDVVKFILSDCIGWYDQIQDLLDSKSYHENCFSLYLAPFDYTYVFDDAVLASQIKTVVEIIILGCTALTCLRIGFQIFGIKVGDSDDS